MASKFCAVLSVLLVVLGLGMLVHPLDAAEVKDSESASHGDAAATYQVVETYGYPGFKVIQFNLAVLSHYSYMLISQGEALIIDPGQDVATYLETAQKEGARIKGVFLTHSHADFVAGHLELVKAVGCPIYQNGASGAGYEIRPLKEGSTLEVGAASLRFVEAPGHTPDGMCAYVYSAGKKDTPELIFTGDTLFVGSIGRPDLLEGKMTAATLASMSYDTWMKKLSKAGDNVTIFPAHGAGSLCGAHLRDEPNSTIGAEKASNPYFQHKSRAEFIAAVLDGLPEAPQYFKHNAAMNRKGPELVKWDASLPPPATLDKALTDPTKVYLVDIRDAGQYAAGHVPNAVNIAVRGRFETWVGIMVPWGENLVLCGNPEELKEAQFRLHRVGYKPSRVVSMGPWANAGLPVSRNDPITPQDLYGLMQKGDPPVVVDVRLPNEWMGMRIGSVVNLPLTHLSELSAKLDPAMPVVTVCNSAYRSSMAIGLLERKGFQKVSSLAGGSEAWIKAGLPVYGAELKAAARPTTAPAAPKHDLKLPERLSAAELNRLVLDLPGTYDLVDIRPAQQFADYSIPSSINVDIADLLANPAYLAGVGSLIIVDRDGSLAMVVAGILSQKTQRVIKALHGGLEAYWVESALAGPSRGMVGNGQRAPAPAAGSLPQGRAPGAVTAPGTPSVPSAPAVPQPPKKKSAGC
jgi:hydroxyacylglutathione hydrolase